MTDEFKLKTIKGKIKSFDPHTAQGVVALSGTKKSFELTCFRSGSVSRYPESGETVEAVVSKDGTRLVSIWAQR